MTAEISHWYMIALPADSCSNGHSGFRCDRCEPDGFCDSCETFEGRGIELICEYASTCDGCHELVHHDLQRTIPGSDDQLGYCYNCRPDLFSDEGLTK